jgi:hypothetical protein
LAEGFTFAFLCTSFTMDQRKLEQSLLDLTNIRYELSKLKYDEPAYDDLEEELHDLEDKFLEEYGTFLDQIITEVHDEYCPDSEVLEPIAYLVKAPQLIGMASEGKPFFQPGKTDGVLVDAEDFPKKQVRLVLLPNPTRLVFNVSGTVQKELWKLS